MNWISALDRFDDVLKSFNARYGLDVGPQTSPFGVSILLQGSPETDEKRLKELGFGADGDRDLVESILVFSRLLVEKCANRSIYNSTDRLNDLLNTTSLSLLHVTLRLTIFLAQRFSERMPGTSPITKFYEYDHERLRRLASPFGQATPASRRPPLSPVKSAKGKDKLMSTRARRSSTAVNPNDFRTLCRESSAANGTSKSATVSDREWSTWAHVKVSWAKNSEESNQDQPDTAQSVSAASSTPTPLRRQTTSSTSNVNGSESTADDAAVPNKAVSEPCLVELSPSDLANASIEDCLRNVPKSMPLNARYELLHKLRLAYGLVESPVSRRTLLAVRMLAISAVANIFPDTELSKNLLSSEYGMLKPQELVQQLISLIQDLKKGQTPVSLYIQTLSMETLAVLARHKMFASDIVAALAANSSNGLLLRLTQRGLQDIAQDTDDTDNAEGDDWREALFSMPRVVIEAAGNHGRSSENTISSSFITTYNSGLNVLTGKSLRIHLRMLDFIKTYFHHFKDGLQVLLASATFETIANLLRSLSEDAWQQLQAGKGIPATFKTRMIDYEIPYINQQIIRSIVDMINDISGHQGPNADRVLRSLIDSQPLLVSIKMIIDHLQAFGAHTWSEVIKALTNVMNNEPTSFTVISEASIIKSFLSTVTGRDSGGLTEMEHASQTVSSESSQSGLGIPATPDAMVNVASLFEAICLTSSGFDLFKASGALEKFFEIFESPAHVKVIKSTDTAKMLGSSIDELVRHHPNLRSEVLSAVTVMLARVRSIGYSMAFNLGAGPKLFTTGPGGELEVCGGTEALRTEIVPPSRADTTARTANYLGPISLPNGKTLSFDEATTNESPITAPRDQDEHDLNATDYIRSAVGFLSALFTTQSLCTSFLELGTADVVLDMVTMPSIPINEHAFGFQSFIEDLASVVHMMAEVKPHLVMPVLADRTRFACSQLKHFSQCQPRDVTCYLAPFVQESAVTAQASKSSIDLQQNGTYIVKSLMATFCLAQVLSEVFNAPVYGGRSSQTFLFGQVNLADVFADLCRMLGTVSAACLREEIALQRTIQEPWLKATKPENFSTNDDEVDQILSVWDSSSRNRSGSISNVDQQNGAGDSVEEDAIELDRKSAAFSNVKALRYLLIETPAAITEFLSNVGHGIVGRKRLETFTKQKSALVAEALAGAYVSLLQPYFLRDPGTDKGMDKDARFAYLVVALSNIKSSFYDDVHHPGHTESCQTFVVDAFRKAGGLQSLTNIGTEFFSELKLCKVEASMFSANVGLKLCLEILKDLTETKAIVDSPQAGTLKNNDPTKPFFFVPSQVLLELRMEALPLTRLVWDSEYANQASEGVLQKLVSILKHVLTGESEADAVQVDSKQPILSPFTPRKFSLDVNKVGVLTEKGFEEDLAREALYRSNSNHSASWSSAEEYCRAFMANPRRARLPIPTSETDVAATTRETPQVSSPPPAGQSFSSELAAGPIEAALAEVVNATSESNDMDIVDEPSGDTDDSADARPQTSGSSAMDLSTILNQPEESKAETAETPAVASTPAKVSIESLNNERSGIRAELTDRCINVLNNHSSLVFELSDLVLSATKKLTKDEAKDYWDETSGLLVSNLMSLQGDDEVMSDAKGKRVAAATHLTALLMHDPEVFIATLEFFKSSFEGLLSFLKLPPSLKADETYPWISTVLLIVEKMLSRDNEPAEVKWDHPQDLDTSNEAVLTTTEVFDRDQRVQLFGALIELLPRVGKDKTTALSIARVLVTLTRRRELATLMGEKRNIQRLFLMMKQLGHNVNSRLLSSFMIILRHVVEDEETIKQVMRSEIVAALQGRTSTRQLDVTSYCRDLYHLVLRSPELFVEVTNELVKLSQWQPHSPGAGLVLKKPEVVEEPIPVSDPNVQDQAETADTGATEAATSIEGNEAGQPDAGKSKVEIKPPVVEHPDGVIHFILSELLSYKEIEDKEVTAAPSEENPSMTNTNGDTPSSDLARSLLSDGATGDHSMGILGSPADTKAKRVFKPEDHPIFVYRCFLLQCLTELLHSYNRTKVEFINFSRKADPTTVTPSKPRSGILNYILNGLVASGFVDKDDNSIHCKKRVAVSDWAIRVVVALCSKTGEKGISAPPARYSAQLQVDDNDDETELTFVRRFALEHAMRAFKEATSSTEALQAKYSKLLCLSDMFNRLLSKPTSSEGSAGAHNTSYKVLGRMMFEKNLISVLTSSLAEIDLSHPGAKRVIKYILRPLQDLTGVATQLSLTSPELISSVLGNTSDDDISSASSVSEVDDEREETPDLFRNSALGMLDPNRHPGTDSDSDEDEMDEDEDMFDEEGYEDEMDYDEGMGAVQEGDEAISDDEDGHIIGGIEGLPGDAPVQLEIMMQGGEEEMDVDSEDDENEEDDSDTDSEEDDDEDDGESIEVEEEGEINGDDENDSLGDGHDDEGEWEDEDGEEDAADLDEDGGEIEIDLGTGGGDPNGEMNEFSNLLRVLRGPEGDEIGAALDSPHGLMVPPPEAREDDDRDEDDEDDEDEEAMDENEEIDFENFDDYGAYDRDDWLDGEDDWRWEDPVPRPNRMFSSRRHLATRAAVRSHPPGFLSRRMGQLHQDAGGPWSYAAYARSRRGVPGRADADDGTNPLLQRSATPNVRPPQPRPGNGGRGPPSLEGLPGLAGLLQLPAGAAGAPANVIMPPAFSATLPIGEELGGHGNVLDAVLNALNAGASEVMHNGRRLNFSLGENGRSVVADLGDMMGPPGLMAGFHHHHHHHRHQNPADGPRAVPFTPTSTTTRWQEEARILYGNTYVDKVQRVQLHVISQLVPQLQKDEKERRRKVEEERKAREEEEKRRIEEEKVRLAEEERERKEKEAKQAEEDAKKRAEEEAARAAATEETSSDQQAHDAGPMEGVQHTENDDQPVGEGHESAAVAAAPEEAAEQPRVFTTIRGRQLDITGLDIDLDYIEALPEEFREEVIMQQYANRREREQENEATGDGAGETAASGIDPDFLNALPEELREEMIQQEAQMQRQREREAARRQVQATGGTGQAGEMENDDFLATLDPALRRAILAEQPEEILNQLAPHHRDEGQEHHRRIYQQVGMLSNRHAMPGTVRTGQAQPASRRQVVQLVDKAGVATLLRLMFLPQQGSLRANLWHILRNVCGNRQTRFEVITMLLVILKEGSTDVTAVERSLASLSLRAKATPAQKTPQPLKRTLSLQPRAALSEEVTPLVVVQQCLSALKQLSSHGFHVRTIFLKEVDVSANSKARKGKAKDSKTTKYPVNDLIALLDRKIIVDSTTCLQSLAELLAAVTAPLPVLMRKEKKDDKEDDKKTEERAEPAVDTTEQTPQVDPASTVSPQEGQDSVMSEAPAAPIAFSPIIVHNNDSRASASQIEVQPEGSKDDADEDSAESKAKKQFDPPEIPERNLQLIVGIFVAQECTAETFRFTLETMSSITAIPGTSEVFSKELIGHVKNLSHSIFGDLVEFLPMLGDAQSSTDLHGITTSKFSHVGSDQVKLLQVLKALDYLSEPKKDDEQEEKTTVKSILTTSYEGLALGPLWSKLSECLRVMQDKDNVIAFATILLPLIESLMVVCKNTSIKDAPLARQLREQAPSTPVTEEMDGLEKLFFTFTTEHRKVLNDVIRQSPKLMQGNGSFSLLVKNPKVLDFDNKRAYFSKQIHSRLHQQRHPQSPLQLNVRRDQVFQDSYKALYYKSAEEMKYGKLNIRFNGEEGVDAGGVTREWFQVLARGIFNPDWALWQPVASDRTTFHPNQLSWINGDHLAYFKFIGRIIGKALHEGRVLDCHFSRAVYKRMLGKQPSLKDLESMDLDYYKSLCWILENDITEVITEDFSVVEEQFGEEKIVDLVPDGRNIAVTEDNKQEYIQKLVEYRLTNSVSEQLDHFVRGFHDIIPSELVSIFDEQELELLISGLPEIDVDDWKANTEYHNYNVNSPQVTWFWRIVRAMSNEERAKLLQFITGTSKVPLNGFKDLEGMQGTTRFSSKFYSPSLMIAHTNKTAVHKDPSPTRLPTSHTCFNQLDLPAYDNQDTLKNNIMIAINLGADYFGFA